MTRLEPLIDEVLALLRSTLPSTITVRKEFSLEIDNIRADPSQIHTVLLNVCLNASQAMPNGGDLIVSMDNEDLNDYAISTEEKFSGKFIRILVKDSGTGMEQATLSRVFEPFFTTKKPGEGTGLGLSTAYGIVRQHGGFITVTSSPGEGSSFQIYLPITLDNVDEELPEELSSGGTESILFVDDDSEVTYLCKEILEDLGYRVRTETNSTMALGVFREQANNFDLIITDQIMPGITGDKLAEEVLEVRSDIPIIVCSGDRKYLSTQFLQDLQVDEFILKPIDPVDLGLVVRRVLDRYGKIE